MTMIIHRIALRGLLLSMALWCFMPMHGAQRDGVAYSVSSGDWLAFTHALLPSNASGMDEMPQPLMGGCISLYKSSSKEGIKSPFGGLAWSELDDYILSTLRYAIMCIYCVTSSKAASKAVVAVGRGAGVFIHPDGIRSERIAANSWV